jgi:hypothetical protein
LQNDLRNLTHAALINFTIDIDSPPFKGG